jgi:hypothetical protein
VVFGFLSDRSNTRAAAVFPAVFWAGFTTAGDWPQFRGPAAGGVDAGAPAPIQWSIQEDQNIRWHTPIPGLAHSSPIVWGNMVYVATAVGPGKARRDKYY